METSKIKERYIYLYLIILGFIVCLLTRYISPLYNTTAVDTDVLLTIGRGWLNGKMPYRDLYDHKGFILHFLYMLSAFIQSNGYIGIFIIDTIIVTIDLFALYKLITLFCKEKNYQIAIITIIGLIMHIHCLGGLALQSETMAIGCYSYALYLMIRKLRDDIEIKDIHWYFIGITSALLLWSKITLTGFYIGYIIPYFIYCIKQKKLKTFCKNILFIVLGILTITLPFFIYMLCQGYFENFLHTYFYQNLFNYKDTDKSILIVYLTAIKKYLIFINLSLFPIIAVILKIKNRPSPKLYLCEPINQKEKPKYKSVIILSFITAFICQFLNRAGWGYYYTIFIIWTTLGLIIILRDMKQKGYFKYLLKKRSPFKNAKQQLIMSIIPILFLLLCFTRSGTINYLVYMKDRQEFMDDATSVIKKDWETKFLDVMTDNDRLLSQGAINSNIKPRVLEYDLLMCKEYTDWDITPDMKTFAFLGINMEENIKERNKLIEEKYPDYIVISINKDIDGYTKIYERKIRNEDDSRSFDILRQGDTIYIYRKD